MYVIFVLTQMALGAVSSEDVFVADLGQRKIFKVEVLETQTVAVTICENCNATALAYDRVEDVLYFTTESEVWSLEFAGNETLQPQLVHRREANTNNEFFSDIDIDELERYIYVIVNTSATIFRIRMTSASTNESEFNDFKMLMNESTNINSMQRREEVIWSQQNSFPQKLYINAANRTLFWIDYATPTGDGISSICSIDIGSNISNAKRRKMISTSNYYKAVDLTLDSKRNIIYWLEVRLFKGRIMFSLNYSYALLYYDTPYAKKYLTLSQRNFFVADSYNVLWKYKNVPDTLTELTSESFIDISAIECCRDDPENQLTTYFSIETRNLDHQQNQMVITVSVVSVIFSVITIALLTYFVYHKRKKSSGTSLKPPEITFDAENYGNLYNPYYTDLSNEDIYCSIDPDDIEIQSSSPISTYIDLSEIGTTEEVFDQIHDCLTVPIPNQEAALFQLKNVKQTDDIPPNIFSFFKTSSDSFFYNLPYPTKNMRDDVDNNNFLIDRYCYTPKDCENNFKNSNLLNVKSSGIYRATHSVVEPKRAINVLTVEREINELGIIRRNSI